MHFIQNFLICKLLCSYQILDLLLLIQLHLMKSVLLIVIELVWVSEKLVVWLVELNLICYQLILKNIWIMNLRWHCIH